MASVLPPTINAPASPRLPINVVVATACSSAASPTVSTAVESSHPATTCSTSFDPQNIRSVIAAIA